MDFQIRRIYQLLTVCKLRFECYSELICTAVRFPSVCFVSEFWDSISFSHFGSLYEKNPFNCDALMFLSRFFSVQGLLWPAFITDTWHLLSAFLVITSNCSLFCSCVAFQLLSVSKKLHEHDLWGEVKLVLTANNSTYSAKYRSGHTGVWNLGT